MILGSLDQLNGNHIAGWLGAKGEKIAPFITANGKACTLLSYGQPRPDVAEATGLHTEVGYVAQLPDITDGIIDFKLYALFANGKKQFVQQQLITPAVERIDNPGIATTAALLKPQDQKITKKQLRNIVLIWKQHDAGIYGRRVDQVARSLTCLGRDCKITLLETMTRQQLQDYQTECDNIYSDKQYIFADFQEKKTTKHSYGVNYKTLFIEESSELSQALENFLQHEDIRPDNSLFILFPILIEHQNISQILATYTYICDIVDNQLSWNGDNPFPVLQQYACLCCDAAAVIFNSEVNQQFFIANELCLAEKTLLIPNWYTTPLKNLKRSTRRSKNHVDILYSGNMNDRIDWKLIEKIHEQCGDKVIIHLIGNSDTLGEYLTTLIEKHERIIYHGPMREEQLLEFSKQCDLAIMPHLHDNHSNYMNPLKLHMYAAIKMPCISTQVPGVTQKSPYLKVCKNHDEFIAQLNALISKPLPGFFRFELGKHKSQKNYLKLVKTIAAL